MKILFIGSRLFDDVVGYTKKLGIETIITESNDDADNLHLSDKHYIVSRGMDEPMNIAIKEDVDAVIPLIGIDGPLPSVGLMKDKLEEDNNIPVISCNHYSASIAADKYDTKNFLKKHKIKTPYFSKINKPYDYEQLKEKLPAVFKTPQGQGGSGVKIALTKEDIVEFIDDKNDIFMEEFIEGFEVSIETLRWNNQTVPLCPVYKGSTTLKGIHPLSKIKQAPLNIEGIDNNTHNNQIKQLAIKISELLGFEGTVDIDILYNVSENEDNVIEINTRPSGTRYMTAASTDIYPLCQLVDMARGVWSKNYVEKQLKDFYAAEIPVGNFPENKHIPENKIFEDANSYIVHGPKNYQRVTYRAESLENLNNLVYQSIPNYAHNQKLDFLK